MPRTARRKSETGIYHIILRGINRQTIFKDKEDALQFLWTLEKYKQKSEFKLYAYCLMSNHVHLLLKEEKENLGMTMRRIGASYVYWYNWKHERCGHLFQDRYKSEPVEDDRYFLTVLRYIHQNPIKAGVINKITDYPWSSYREFIGQPKLVDTDFVFNLFDGNREKAKKQFKAFHAIEEKEVCLEVDEKKKWKDQEAIELIKKVCQVNHSHELQNLDREKQNEYVKQLCTEGLSVRQISRITGISRWVIQKEANTPATGTVLVADKDLP
jgi:putative transposase